MTNDASSFWVGPADDPFRFRLTHLLGSGGEGEVWRAVRAREDDTEVAIKINTLSATSGDEDTRLRALAGLKVKGLVGLREVFSGPARRRRDDDFGTEPTHQYVVMDYVAGVTLRTWLDEHPDVPARRRVKVLRGVAAALTRLHDGPVGQAAMTHGDVKPTNIIIGTDGTPVLVDFGLLRSAGSGPASGHSAAYSSPELRNPDGIPSPQADTFSFAVTAMETLTALTPPLDADGNLDLDATRDRIATAPALHVRPVLRRQLLRSLTIEPAGRPRTPVRVFAGRAAALALVPLLLVSGGAGTALALQPASERTATASTSPPSQDIVLPPPMTGAPSPTPTSTSTKVPVQHLAGNLLTGFFDDVQQFPWVDYGCDRAVAGDAMPTDSVPNRSWGNYSHTLTLTADRDIDVLKVTRERKVVDGPPVLEQQISVSCLPGVVFPPMEPPSVDPCSDESPKPNYLTDTTYLADLRTNSLVETLKRSAPFGVFDQDRCLVPPSTLELRTDNCVGNFEYTISIQYRVHNEPHRIYTQSFEPLLLQSRVSNGIFETRLAEVGSTHRHRFSGPAVGCGDRTEVVPYASLAHEAAELVVQAVGTMRTDRESLEVTISRVAEFLNSKLYTAEKIKRLCDQVANEPHRWRSTCGNPDTVEPDPSPTPTPTSTTTPTPSPTPTLTTTPTP